MISGILLWWLGIVANAPVWYFVLDGFLLFLSIVSFVIQIIKGIEKGIANSIIKARNHYE